MHPELKAHPVYFQPEIVLLADNLHRAFGFAASHVYMIVCEDGLVILGTSEPTAAAADIPLEFGKINELSIKRIILTHSHCDHV